ncbi:MAG: hypothetical protein HYX78_15695 [Armatimonadetes bacterium]|nr:hypothetical protein [Armatimonadota bacterium]
MGRPVLSANGRVHPPREQSDLQAFEIHIKDDPSMSVGVPVTAGWQMAQAKELPRTKDGQRHFVVALTNTVRPVEVKVHTLLDGTSVMVRWIEITNKSDKSVALTKVYSWSGMLWQEGSEFTVGHQTRDEPGVEGWFQ